MYKIKGGKLKVFSKYISMLNGTHSVYVNKEAGSISHNDQDGDLVVTYTHDEITGRVTIDSSSLTELGLPFNPPTRARSWMNGRKISSGPLYGSDKDITVYLEGFAFDFDYNTIVCSAMAIKPFRWTGGRVCFDDMFSGGSTNQGRYTAIPGSGSCGQALIDTYDSGLGQVGDIATLYGASGVSGATQAEQQNAIEYYGNDVSVVFSYRSFKKYISFARGMSGIFTCSLGEIGGRGANLEPDGVIPDPTGKSFEFSMFNLKQ